MLVITELIYYLFVIHSFELNKEPISTAKIKSSVYVCLFTMCMHACMHGVINHLAQNKIGFFLYFVFHCSLLDRTELGQSFSTGHKTPHHRMNVMSMVANFPIERYVFSSSGRPGNYIFLAKECSGNRLNIFAVGFSEFRL